MKSEHDVLRKFADEIAERITRKTISELQGIKETLSADDSGLDNCWDEICAQLQFQRFISWGVYEEVIHLSVMAHVKDLKEHERIALWFQTYEGWDWLYDNPDEKNESPPVFNEDIKQYVVKDYLYEKAGNWSNKRIRDFLGWH